MGNGDETADSYKTTADLLLSKRGDRNKILNLLFKAARSYSNKNRNKAIACLDELHNNLKGSTTEFGMDQYFRYLHQLARAYEDLEEKVLAADIYSELAKEIYRLRARLEWERIYTHFQILKKFTAYLAKALILYDSADKYDSILKLARTYYKIFPELQKTEGVHGELYFCYEHIIHAADVTGSRYFREYYADLDNKLRGIEVSFDEGEEGEGKGPYGEV